MRVNFIFILLQIDRVFAKLVKVLQIVKLPSLTVVECPHHPNV